MSRTISKSTLKTKMRRAGFRCGPHHGKVWWPDGTESKTIRRSAWRQGWMYCQAHGRHYRVRWHAGVVDIGEVYETFDRWANSCERTLSIEEFVQEFLR